MRKRLGVMCSGNGTNFQNIVTNQICNHHEVVLMIHNKKKCGASKRADKWGIPHCYVHYKNEDKMIELFDEYNVDLIILAGYMRVLKKPNEFSCPIINVHPSLLPKYKGLNTHKRVIENNEKFSGCTVHYVNSKLDSGKIILQKKVKIKKKENYKTLQKKILKQEHILYPKAIMKIFNL